jgi:hypothetical protein
MTDTEVYSQLCQSYRAIDDFRAKLLGFLPLATAAGVFALLPKDVELNGVRLKFLEPIAVFGVFTTIGLYVYELYGISRCTYLIELGKYLEHKADIYGQFRARPDRQLNEPFAAAVIYPAVVAAWTFLAVYGLCLPLKIATSSFVFLAGFLITRFYTSWSSSMWLKEHTKLAEGQEVPQAP